jgi:hypothetical protein
MVGKSESMAIGKFSLPDGAQFRQERFVGHDDDNNNRDIWV